jgi:hypothetical protein
VGDSLTVEQRTLTPLVVVRIHVPQPVFSVSPRMIVCAGRALNLMNARHGR